MKVPLDFAIDTSGRPEMIRAAVAAVHSAGVVVLIAAGRTDAVADIPLRELSVELNDAMRAMKLGHVVKPVIVFSG